jgi:hypothetical protein
LLGLREKRGWGFVEQKKRKQKKYESDKSEQKNRRDKKEQEYKKKITTVGDPASEGVRDLPNS